MTQRGGIIKGILFKPDMHLAIREGRKTQTRRSNGIEGINREPDKWIYIPSSSIPAEGRFAFYYDNCEPYHRQTATIVVKSLYRVGELVYIKEVWCANKQYDDLQPSQIPDTAMIWYRLTSPIVPSYAGKWRSPMFLKECDARDFIQITDVKPERLQEITEEDAGAEGAAREFEIDIGNFVHNRQWNPETASTYRLGFKHLWDSINKPPYDWASNPWVWVYTFKKTLDKPLDTDNGLE